MINSAVHGAAIALVIAFVFGLSVFPSWLGLHRPLVRSAAIVYSLGGLGMISAATISGFIVPNYMERLVNANEEELLAARQILELLHVANRVCDHGGVIEMSAGVILWSMAMLFTPTRSSATGILGLIAGLLGIVGLVTGHTSATVHGVLVFVILQGAWNTCVGVLLWRYRPLDVAHRPSR